MTKRGPIYHSYLLRMWPAGNKGQTPWRASLDNSRTGERIGFSSLEELFDFLLRQTAIVTEENTDSGEAGGNLIIPP